MPEPLIRPSDLEIPPIERAQTIPSRWYTSNEVLEFEKEHIFSQHWQLAGHESQIRETGDILTLEIADNPILIVRDKQKKLRAFYNVCKHRGGPMAVKKGTTSVLQCQYHGWTYLLDGSLRGVPHFNFVELFDKKDFGLTPIPLETWQGLIFLNLDEDAIPLADVLNGIAERIAPIDLSKLIFHSEYRYTVNCNWKVYVDNFLEGYHIPIVHPELAKLLDYNQYKTETANWYSLQHSPFKSEENIYGEKEGEAFYYYIFPNIMFNILPGRLQTNIIRPINAGTTEVIFHYYYRDIESEKARKVIESDISYSDDIQQEDIEICEEVQKGLRSKAYDKGRFSVEREEGVYHFQSLLKEVFKKSLNGSAVQDSSSASAS